MEGVVAGAPSDLPDGRPRFNGPTKAHLEFVEAMKRSDGEGFIGFWEAMVREELRADPSLLDPR